MIFYPIEEEIFPRGLMRRRLRNKPMSYPIVIVTAYGQVPSITFSLQQDMIFCMQEV